MQETFGIALSCSTSRPIGCSASMKVQPPRQPRMQMVHQFVEPDAGKVTVAAGDRHPHAARLRISRTSFQWYRSKRAIEIP
jgi:hypothetical protein